MSRLRPQASLFHKYFAYFALLVGGALLASAATDLYFSHKERRTALVTLQRERALGAAVRIEQFANDIERQIAWTVLPNASDGSALDQRYLELLKLLRQVPAITDASWLDASGREQVHVSRVSLDRVGSGLDRSGDRAFREPKPGQPYFGPVYFRKDTEPYMTVAVAPGLDGEGVTVAEVNLKLVWDLVARIGIGRTGHAYVVDGRGQLVSHPDISRVLKKSDLSQLPQVRSALAGSTPPGDGLKDPGPAQDLQGNAVLTAHAPIAELGWLVFVEQPLSEAYAPLHASMRRSGLLLLVALALSVLASLFLARRMALPIRALQQGAARIGAGELDHRMKVSTGDELGQLAGELNRMAARLRESYGDLERKVAERTQELELANQAKARFLRAASHDLRQPIHALGLFVDQLSARALDQETRRIATLAGVAVANLQDLLDAVLDISRLDAGAITPVTANFAIEVASRPGTGSTFAVEVPRGVRPPIQASSAPAPDATDSLSGALVLVVDDDAPIRDAMHSLLTQWGCTAATAANGEEAIAVLRRLERVPDAVLADYRLNGEETGAQIIRRLHAVARTEIPAALITGDAAPESLHEAQASGYPVLAKPVAPAKLRALIAHLASASRKRPAPGAGKAQAVADRPPSPTGS